MTKRTTYMLAIVIACGAVAPAAAAEGEAAKNWTEPTADDIRPALDDWLAEQRLDDATRAKVDALWPAEATPVKGAELFDRLIATVALVDPEAQELVDFCRAERTDATLPQFGVFSKAKQSEYPPLVKHNLRLYYGRWLGQQRLYDESLEQLADLRPEEVVDPGTLMFYQCVAYHRLLDKKQFIPIVERLMTGQDKLPRRYGVLARLLKADLAPLKTDTLDEVSRLMDDIRRRLDLGRHGKRVRDQQEDVVAKLKKMIKKLEDQQKQQQSSSSSGSSPGQQPSSPMQDSQGGGAMGPGQTDPRGKGSDRPWGNVQKEEQEKIIKQLDKNYPSHYRRIIDKYFEKMAEEGVIGDR